jgi:2-dehydro-3-deoxyphosphogluconate aldolase / (4S)-4-hydroxy-2-oxoglutarate aldolase
VNKNIFSLQKFLTLPVIGIIRGLTIDETIGILPYYIKAGFTTVEITMNTPNAEQIIRLITAEYNGVLNIGAGTVCNDKELDLAVQAGAQFIVMPIVNESVIKSCVKQKIPVFPGAYTATEIFQAWSLGAEMVKVFPATSLGPEYIKDIRGPLSQIKLVPVGGINIDNCLDYMKAGATGLGIGSQLFDIKKIREKNWEELSNKLALFANKMKQYTEQISIS